jgi:hypothetical protein
MTTELFTAWHDVLVATNDSWIAEKTRLLLILEKSKENGKAYQTQLARIQEFILTMDDTDKHPGLATLAEYLDHLAFCYPQLRKDNNPATFIPAGSRDALHIRPDKEPDLATLPCPYCHDGRLGSVQFPNKKGFDISTVGCLKCGKRFTPDELTQIRSLERMKAATKPQ